MAKTLQEEAKKFTQQKRKPTATEGLTPRLYLAGQALSGFIANGRNTWRMQEIKKEGAFSPLYLLKLIVSFTPVIIGINKMFNL